MTRPQSAELRDSGRSGPVPEASSPGHHPEREQDKPDLDAFAERFSGRALDDLPTDTGVLDGGDRADRTTTGGALRRAAPTIIGIVAVAAVAAAVTILVRRRRT